MDAQAVDLVARMDARLALWLSSVTAALVLVVAAFLCHSHRDTKAKMKLLEHAVALPELRREQNELADSVDRSVLAAECTISGNGRPPPAETRVPGPQNEVR